MAAEEAPRSCTSPSQRADVLPPDVPAIVEALELLLVHDLAGAENSDVASSQAAEVEAHGAGQLLAIVEARRQGYYARRDGKDDSACPFPVDAATADEIKGRAAWLLGWILRDLAERARAGEPPAFPDHLVVGSQPLTRFPFLREMHFFGQLAAKRRRYAERWKRAASTFFDSLRAETKSASWQAYMREKMAAAMAESFLAAGGVNFVEWRTRFHDDRLGEMVLTLARVEGLTAAELIDAAKGRAAAAEAQVKHLEGKLHVAAHGVKRFLVALGARVPVVWRDHLIEDCGLGLTRDVAGFIQVGESAPMKPEG